LKIVLFSFLLAFIPAVGIAIARVKNIRIVAVPARFFVSANRGFPVLLQILIIYSFVPALLNSFFERVGIKIKIFDLNPIVYAYIVFTLHCIASVSEIFRSALLTVSKGQYEAGLCIGLSAIQTYRRIILPQALVSALPNLCSTTVILIKNTSLAFMMTVREITGVAKIEAAYGYNYVESYIDIFVIYIFVCLAVELLFRRIERRLVFAGVRRAQTN